MTAAAAAENTAELAIPLGVPDAAKLPACSDDERRCCRHHQALEPERHPDRVVSRPQVGHTREIERPAPAPRSVADSTSVTAGRLLVMCGPLRLSGFDAQAV